MPQGVQVQVLLCAPNSLGETGDSDSTPKQLESSIESYKSSLGIYPPDNHNSGLNQLYYELAGTVYSNGVFTTKDNAGQSPSWAMITTIFGTVSGFVNKRSRKFG